MEPFYDRSLSMVLALRTQAEAFRCWRNAAVCIARLPALFQPGSYIEGWIVIPRLTRIDIQEHGWCRAGERLLDPTFALQEPEAPAVFHFPGFQIPAGELLDRIAGKVLPLVCQEYGEEGLGHEGYKRAYDQAWECARRSAALLHLPDTAIHVGRRDPAQRGWTVVVANEAEREACS